jgi:cytochrome c-type biogenesis protein CcmH
VRPGAAATAAVLAILASASPALAATPKTSLTAVEDQVMCTSCHEPLALAQSPQAISERDYIRMLIARGDSEHQILDELVAQYGTAVLALPPRHGFNLLVYVLPPAAVLLAALGLGWSLPKWRRRARDAQAAATAHGDGGSQALDPADARRLDEDLAQFGR